MTPQHPDKFVVLKRSYYNRLYILGGSSIRDQEVDHSLGFDEQVAAQKEDAEDHSESEHKHQSDGHHVQCEAVWNRRGPSIVGPVQRWHVRCNVENERVYTQ